MAREGVTIEADHTLASRTGASPSCSGCCGSFSWTGCALLRRVAGRCRPDRQQRAGTGARTVRQPSFAPGGRSALDQLLQHALNALILGGTYALLGIGLTLIFGIMRVVNFTHGELYAFGAYMMYMLVMKLGLNFFAALVFSVILGIALGALIELVLLSRLRGADIDTTMLVMIGAWITMQNIEQLVWSGVAKSITITASPAQPVGFQEIMGSAMTAPQTLPDTLAIDVTANN